jgi:hypothetical protein
MKLPFVFNLNPSPAYDVKDIRRETPTLTLVQTHSAEEQVVTLRMSGMSIENIRKVTNLPERKIKLLIKDVVVVKQPASPYEKCIARVYPLAIRKQGIREYELRQIAYEEYGTTWNEKSGKYEASYDKNTLSRLRQNVREKATALGERAAFVMDWINNFDPTGSRLSLERASVELHNRVIELVDDFMSEHCTDYSPDQMLSTEAQNKQQYAAERHILKLAIKIFTEKGEEPAAALLERSLTLTDLLDGTSDAPLRSIRTPKGGPFPEPADSNVFLDFAESRGWLNPADYPEVERSIAAAGY